MVSGSDRVPKVNLCKACHNAEERQHMITYTHRHIGKLEEQQEEWLSLIAAVPRNYPTLTEEQWIAACQHFNGCAWCGKPDIDTRGFFVDFKRGGRYCDWNVVPLCAECTKSISTEMNPFRLAETRDRIYGQQSRLYRDSLTRIVDYLEPKLRKGVEYGQQKGKN